MCSFARRASAISMSGAGRSRPTTSKCSATGSRRRSFSRRTCSALTLGSSQRRRTGDWPESTLRALSERYGVSREVVVRRLYSLGLTTWECMRAKTDEYRAAHEEWRSREREKKKGGPGWHQIHVRDLGRPYVRLALDAYYRDDINASELAGYLEVKLNKLAALEEELVRAEARR